MGDREIQSVSRRHPDKESRHRCLHISHLSRIILESSRYKPMCNFLASYEPHESPNLSGRYSTLILAELRQVFEEYFGYSVLKIKFILYLKGIRLMLSCRH